MEPGTKEELATAQPKTFRTQRQRCRDLTSAISKRQEHQEARSLLFLLDISCRFSAFSDS